MTTGHLKWIGLLGWVVCMAACDAAPGEADAAPDGAEMGAPDDGGEGEAGPTDAMLDAEPPPDGMVDRGPVPDGAALDATMDGAIEPPPDEGVDPDGASPDLGHEPDVAAPDAALPDAEPPCEGPEDCDGQICDDGACRACTPADCGDQGCGDDGRCGPCAGDGECGEGRFCFDGLCGACDPEGHAGCGADELCCLRGIAVGCEPTGPGQCAGCDLPCDAEGDVVGSNACVARMCRCGAEDACGEASPFCIGEAPAGVCSECGADADCDAESTAPVCGADVEGEDTNTCRGCAADDECADHPRGARCIGEGDEGGACHACDPADDVGCDPESDAPTCDAETYSCRGCEADDECPGELLCFDGACLSCDTPPAACPEGQVCQAGACIPETVIDAMIADGRFAGYVDAVEVAGLTAELREFPATTVFAPVNAAFGAVSGLCINIILNDPEVVRDFVRHHVGQGLGRLTEDGFDALGAPPGAMIPTLARGMVLLLSDPDMGRTIDGRPVIGPPLVAGNGLVYPIGEDVLYPVSLIERGCGE